MAPDKVQKGTVLGGAQSPKSGAGHGPGLLCGPYKSLPKTGAGHGPKSGAGHGPGGAYFVRRRRRTHSKSGAGHGWTLSGAGAGRCLNRVRRRLLVLGVLAGAVLEAICCPVSRLATQTKIFLKFRIFVCQVFRKFASLTALSVRSGFFPIAYCIEIRRACTFPLFV